MKLLVISDTHGNLKYARHAIGRLLDKISGVIHLGDMAADADALEAECNLPFCVVAGNCDFYFSAKGDLRARKIIEINGAKILLTHGHKEGVKRDYSPLAENAEKNGCKAALCGHTHEPFNKTIGGILVLNPGSAAIPRGRARFPSYAVLDISDDGQVSAGVVEMR